MNSPSPPRWIGFLYRTDTGVAGHLVDAFSMTTEIIGTPDVRDGVRGYAIEARLVSLPQAYAIPADSDDPSITIVPAAAAATKRKAA